MLRSKSALIMVVAGIFASSMLSSCLPQTADGGGSPRKKLVQSGETNGANSTTPAPQTPPATQSTPIPPTPAPEQNPECYKAAEFLCKVERIISEKTNKYRAGRGLQPLKLDAKISFVARDWSQKQSKSGLISHWGFPNSRENVYRTEFGARTDFSAENVAYTSGVRGSSSQSDAAAEAIAEEFAVMWWKSAGHRRNMLGSFTSIGVGIAQRSNGAWYATQVFE